jgi:hypothetical protein
VRKARPAAAPLPTMRAGLANWELQHGLHTVALIVIENSPPNSLGKTFVSSCVPKPTRCLSFGIRILVLATRCERLSFPKERGWGLKVGFSSRSPSHSSSAETGDASIEAEPGQVGRYVG